MLPVVDIFAGPGGLGEGFSQAGYEVLLSAEMDPTACETLKLRKFFHQFRERKVPEAYYKFIRGELELEQLKEKFPSEWDSACNAVANIELGTADGNAEFNRKLDQKLEGRRFYSHWWASLSGLLSCWPFQNAGSWKQDIGSGKHFR